jgi:cytochrome b561
MTYAAAPASLSAPAYSPALRWLHWGIAILIFAAIAAGVTAIYLPGGPVRAEVLMLHKSLGLTVLGLVVPRILTRLAVGAPDYWPALGAFTCYAAALGHLALYALMIAMPIPATCFPPPETIRSIGLACIPCRNGSRRTKPSTRTRARRITLAHWPSGAAGRLPCNDGLACGGEAGWRARAHVAEGLA